MAIQTVMDRTGDSRHLFNPEDAKELARAEQRFYELTNHGFTAAVRTGPGEVSLIRSFEGVLPLESWSKSAANSTGSVSRRTWVPST